MTDKPKRPKDTNQLAKFIVDVATGHDSDVQVDTSKQREDKAPFRGGCVDVGFVVIILSFL